MKKTYLALGLSFSILALAACNTETVEKVDTPEKEPTVVNVEKPTDTKIEGSVIDITNPIDKENKDEPTEGIKEIDKTYPPDVIVQTPTPVQKEEVVEEEPLSDIPTTLEVTRLDIVEMKQASFGVVNKKEDISAIIEAFNTVKLEKYESVDGQEVVHEFVVKIGEDFYGYSSDERYGEAIIFKNDNEYGVMNSELSTMVHNTFVKHQNYH